MARFQRATVDSAVRRGEERRRSALALSLATATIVLIATMVPAQRSDDGAPGAKPSGLRPLDGGAAGRQDRHQLGRSAVCRGIAAGRVATAGRALSAGPRTRSCGDGIVARLIRRA